MALTKIQLACPDQIFLFLWGLYQALYHTFVFRTFHVLLAILATLFCILVDLLEEKISLPPSLHFILFGAGRKFNKTDWNPTPVVPLFVTLGLGFGGYWVGIWSVTILQVVRANKLFKRA